MFSASPLLVAALLACTGPEGPRGPDGLQGPVGPIGPQGPVGPLTDPPALTTVDPGWGSSESILTLRGAGFSATPADDVVWFDGAAATVTAATTTTLTVRPPFAVDGPVQTVVTVEVAHQVSNAVTFELVPSGTPRALPWNVPSAPTGVCMVGSDLYVAGGGPGPAGGLYRVDATGVTTRVLAADPIALPVGWLPEGAPAFDTPVAVTTDGTHVLLTTIYGGILRYDPASDETTELLARTWSIDPGALTGVTVDPDGWVYAVDRDAGDLVRVDPDGVMDHIGAFSDPYAVVAAGEYLYVTDGPNVERVGDTHGTVRTPAEVALPWAYGMADLRGLTVLGTDVVASDAARWLWTTPLATGGELLTWGDDVDGYGYGAEALWADASDLYLAQSGSSAVRLIPSGHTDATVVSAGLRVEFGATRLGDDVYLATMGLGLFGDDGGPGRTADGAVVRVSPDGTSEVVYTSTFPTGIVADGTHLVVSDCFDGTIVRLDPTNGTTTTLLDGLDCAAGLVLDGGTLYYANTAVTEPGPSTIGKLVIGGANTPSFVTGLPPATVFLARAGDQLLAMPLSLGDSGVTPVPLYQAPLATGGAATLLAPGAAVGPATSLGVAPSGRVFVHRFPFGDLAEIDAATGEVWRFGTTNLGIPGWGESGMAFGMAMTFLPDDTLVVPDVGQLSLVAVAP